MSKEKLEKRFVELNKLYNNQVQEVLKITETLKESEVKVHLIKGQLIELQHLYNELTSEKIEDEKLDKKLDE